MGHSCHAHGNTSGKIAAAFWLNLVFAAIELVGGLLTGSIAILSDALHDFGDAISLSVAWAFEKKSKKQRDERYSYGYRRFSLLGSVFLSGILAVSSVVILIEAGKRILNPQPVHAEGMLWLAVLGIVVNSAAAFRLRSRKTLNEKAVFLHIMEDVLGWVAVLVASIVMLFVDFPALDPILSIGITCWVLFNVYKNMKATSRVFLQAIPDQIDIRKLSDALTSAPGVVSVHDLHVWTLDGESHIMTLHVVTDGTAPETVKERIRAIGADAGVAHVTVELETTAEECSYITHCPDLC